jgi:peptide/nickel transport system permease protein
MMKWWNKLVIRILLAALTIAAGGLLSATLARYAPGFGTDERQLDSRFNQESHAAFRLESVAERNVTTYYVRSLSRMLHGDLGWSRTLHRPVRELLAERGAVTLRLVTSGLLLAWIAAIVLVATTWLASSSAFGIACTTASGLLLCLPAGGLALLLVVLDGPAYLALALVVFPKAYQYLSGLVRATARMPHITMARAKGLSLSRILVWHVAPLIRGEVLALAGVSVGMAVGAAIPVEALCGTPGIGQLAWQSALGRDVPVLTSVSMLVIACTVLGNTGADLLTDDSKGTA